MRTGMETAMKTAALLAAGLLFAGAAHAQTAAGKISLAPSARSDAPRAALVLPKPGVNWEALQQKTAVERRSSDGLTGAVGYLCGIDKFADRASERRAGPTSSYGRQGTFLGASLGVAF